MELSEVWLHRRSVRQYTGEHVPEEDLREVLASGLLAPSSCSRYPLEFILIRDKDMLEHLSRAKVSGAEFVKGADCAILVIGDTELSDAWIEDGAVAMEHMHLSAAALGLGSCWVECRGRYTAASEDTDAVSSDEYLRPLLSIPEKYSVLAFLALGIPKRPPRPMALEKADFSKVHKEKF